MKKTLANQITREMSACVDEFQLAILKDVINKAFKNIEIKEIHDCKVQNRIENQKFLQMYFSAKTIEGCSEKTLHYYRATLERFIYSQSKWVKDITTEDIRQYLADYQSVNKTSKVTIDNIRRIFSSFFGWMEDEDYILKNPVRRIHKVKTAKVVKETLSDENLELLRDACQNARDLALVEFLTSTGMRVGELVLLNQSDINFVERSCVVLGKGNKEREVYFDAKAKLRLLKYLEQRDDDSEALFVSLKKPYKRLTINGVEKILHRLGDQAGLDHVYPHKFRRTMATMAIDKGMPIEQVQRLLGHIKIDTTLHYAMVNQVNVKMAHRKYIG